MSTSTEYDPIDQRERALAWGNEVRMKNADRLKQIRALPREKGERELADLIRCTVDEIHLRARVGYMLRLGVHRRGAAWTRKVLMSVAISPQKRLGELSKRQRKLLAGAIENGASSIVVSEGFARGVNGPEGRYLEIPA